MSARGKSRIARAAGSTRKPRFPLPQRSISRTFRQDTSHPGHAVVMVHPETSGHWAYVMGDSGPWVRHIGTAWRAAARSDQDPALPESPPLGASIEDQAAFWTPPLHLLVYGLGWSRPDLGLAKWRTEGFPRKDPILRVVWDWLGGDRVLDLLTWMWLRDGIQCSIAPGHHPDSPWDVVKSPSEEALPANEAFELRQRTTEWQRVWGGGSDPMHLTSHLGSPLIVPENHNPRFHDDSRVNPAAVNELPRFTLLLDTYAGWYASLHHYKPKKGNNGRSVRTEVFVKPIGWLGEYRHHERTGLYFRGHSYVHLWGN